MKFIYGKNLNLIYEKFEFFFEEMKDDENILKLFKLALYEKENRIQNVLSLQFG